LNTGNKKNLISSNYQNFSLALHLVPNIKQMEDEMKKILVLSFLLITTSLIFSRSFERNYSVGMFYSSLRPYGEWIYFDDNLIVWKPYGVSSFWKPYYEGRWVWTRHGWYWDSFEPYGWAVYHYGRWIYDDYYGWVWIPDNQWAPAWVEWRYNDNYLGWAPLPPYAEFGIDFGIRFSIAWRSHHHFWNFVSYKNFCSPNVHKYLIISKDVERFFDKTKYRTNYHFRDREVYNGGIDKNLIERKSNSRIPERSVRIAEDREASGTRRGDEISIYRPREENLRVDINEIKRSEKNINIERGNVVVNRENIKTEDVGHSNSRVNGVEKRYNHIEVENKSERNDKKELSKPVIKSNREANEIRETRTNIKRNDDENMKIKNENRTEKIPTIKPHIPNERSKGNVESKTTEVNRTNEVKKRR